MDPNAFRIPFEIRRVYYMRDVPAGVVRGKHAHLTLHQYVIAVAGSFDIVLDDGKKRWRQHLNRADEAFYLPPMVWHELDNFSAGSICMVLASDVYDESDYLRDYEEFRMVLKARELDEQHQDAEPRIAQTRISASADGGVAGMPLVQPASLTTASVQPDNRPPRHFTDSLA
ncbi:MAG: FdtA/QdtA family cupin domain-containing protein [Lautropia sp.]|nr:FdtA/QdtA family cupin domain-containing protein [Lautropia sp.]